MFREIKRVSLDFTWPRGLEWRGYLNPYAALAERCKCAACDGTGSSQWARKFAGQWWGKVHFDPVEYGATPLTHDHPVVRALARRNVEQSPRYCGTGEEAIKLEAERLSKFCCSKWYAHLIQADVDALVAADRLWDFTRVPRTEQQRKMVRQRVAEGKNSWLPEPNGYVPTADEVNAWAVGGTCIGHDLTNEWVCIKARCLREGVPLTCATCSGKGVLWPSEEAERVHDEWTPSEPPAGEGYQLWETLTAGSPVSPVFQTKDELDSWCDANATAFGYEAAPTLSSRDTR